MNLIQGCWVGGEGCGGVDVVPLSGCVEEGVRAERMKLTYSVMCVENPRGQKIRSADLGAVGLGGLQAITHR